MATFLIFASFPHLLQRRPHYQEVEVRPPNRGGVNKGVISLIGLAVVSTFGALAEVSRGSLVDHEALRAQELGV